MFRTVIYGLEGAGILQRHRYKGVPAMGPRWRSTGVEVVGSADTTDIDGASERRCFRLAVGRNARKGQG